MNYILILTTPYDEVRRIPMTSERAEESREYMDKNTAVYTRVKDDVVDNPTWLSKDGFRFELTQEDA